MKLLLQKKNQNNKFKIQIFCEQNKYSKPEISERNMANKYYGDNDLF